MCSIQLVSPIALQKIFVNELFISAEIEPNHLRACVCYVENAIGSAKSDLSEDSIERYLIIELINFTFLFRTGLAALLV